VVPRTRATSSACTAAWEFYGVPGNFAIRRMPAPLFGSKPGYAAYTILALTHTRLRSTSLHYFRQMEPAYLAALFGRVAVFESHNHIRNSAKNLMPHWARLVRNPRRRAAMVVTSQAGADAYQALGIPGDRILVARNGVDLRKFTPSLTKAAARASLDLSLAETIVGFSGHLYEGRGIEELLQAARALHEVSFLIVGGDPDDVTKYRALAQEHGVSNAKFVGFVPPNSLPTYLLAADVLVMPYTSRIRTRENMCPMKMFDYLASGRPMVATDFPILREVLQDRHNAILVPPDSGEALASGIRWLLDHPERAAEIGEQARQDAAEYSWENRAGRIVTWVRDLFEI
jgi:glycosyltransferase involved in cell wall biosynthesis